MKLGNEYFLLIYIGKNNISYFMDRPAVNALRCPNWIQFVLPQKVEAFVHGQKWRQLGTGIFPIQATRNFVRLLELLL